MQIDIKNQRHLSPVLVQKFIPTTGANLSGERFPLTAARPSALWASPRTAGSNPRPLSKDFQLCFFCKGYPI